MTDRDRQLLINHMKHTADTVQAFAEQIKSGEYGDQWEVQSFDDPVDRNITVTAHDERSAIDHALEEWGDDGDYEYSDFAAERNTADVPTVDDSSIDEYPLEVVDERGKEFAVVLCTGGPHIEVAADGGNTARLEGYWWGDRWTIHGDHFDTFLDYFIERD